VSEKKTVGVGLVGLGTIGKGVAKVLRNNATIIEQRLGAKLRLVRIADLDLETDRGVDLTGIQFDTDSEGLVRDPAVDIVIELVGGYDFAKQLLLSAIENGKHVVTANKALLALHGGEIFSAAARKGVDVAFEASVAGGIPILRSLREGFAANRILSLYGIMNGTTNYMLTEMEKTGEMFEVVLKRAQDLGYAEADPTFDVDGIDAAHKLCLLSAMAYGATMTFKEIPTEGIRGLVPLDFEAADELGYRIKLLGIASRGEDGVEQRVHPCMVAKDTPIAAVEGAFNGVVAEGDFVGTYMAEGAGAGAGPTASAVVADLMDIARGAVLPTFAVPAGSLERLATLPIERHRGSHYIRLMVLDQPGVIADIAAALRDEAISVEAMFQHGRAPDKMVPVVITTHDTEDAAMTRALARIGALEAVVEPPMRIRIEAL